MMKIKIFILILVVCSCDSLLDIDQKYAQDAESFFNTQDDYEKALIAAYDLLQTSYASLWIGEIASDNAIAGGESVNDTKANHDINNMFHTPVNTLLRDVMRYNYTGITRVNYIFEFQKKLDFERKEELLAEAKFLRAYYYFELVKIFGAVPLVVDRRIGNQEVTQISRTPAPQVYAQIEKDLNEAAKVLSWNAYQKGRVTKGAALGLLGRAFLYQKKYDSAALTLEKIISQNQYELVQVANSTEYADLFNSQNEDQNNKGSVFEIQYSGLEGGGYDCFVCLEGNLAVGFHGIRNYEGPTYASGNSYNLPTKELFDAFESGDIRKEGALLDIDAWAEKNNATYAKGDGGHTGYYNNKYLKRESELGLPDDDLTSPVNHRVLRYADILLMAAEAHNLKATPDPTKALNYLNLVRTRAKLASVNFTGNQLTEAIWNERRFEFAGEGLRFFDLVRTEKAEEKINNFQKNKNELFPIPQIEIDLAGGNWEQNRGY